MVYVLIEKCDLCRHDGRLHTAHYVSYPIHGDPARPTKLRLCDRCWAGWDGHGGLFRGGSKLATKMWKNLQRLTKRPWQWSRSAASFEPITMGQLRAWRGAEFSIHEGTVMPGMTADSFR
jgi:hypothetical protein